MIGVCLGERAAARSEEAPIVRHRSMAIGRYRWQARNAIV
jgi:hypothetical protein